MGDVAGDMKFGGARGACRLLVEKRATGGTCRLLVLQRSVYVEGLPGRCEGTGITGIS